MMSVVEQYAFEIPDDILAGLVTGEYKRFGGVIRNTAGKLITHLKEVPIQKAKDYKAIAIGLGVVAVAAISGLVYVAARSKKEKIENDAHIPKCVEDYNASLCSYLNAIQAGNLNQEIIRNLYSSLDTLAQNEKNGSITLHLSQEQLSTLVNLIGSYTQNLAENNSINLHMEKLSSTTAKNSIVSLQQYLKAQEQIFEMAS